jgi:hypothetical protein
MEFRENIVLVGPARGAHRGILGVVNFDGDLAGFAESKQNLM